MAAMSMETLSISLLSNECQEEIDCITLLPLLLFAEPVNPRLGRLQKTVRGVDPGKSRLQRSKNEDSLFFKKKSLTFYMRLT